ncbi:Nucleotide-diphospho-sugar transferase [Macleaya cordata]|uniref:Nucleotide-diphospho-sugar transferase n=1 Tax=Macleaya cordata TaxID=56857 RepID=A0A200Q9R2_MACCD|nr:Nucleotide-diphospho-sugar transferase [Macleaya cordata]
MDYLKNRAGELAITLILLVGVLYILLWTPDISNKFSSPFHQYCHQSPASNQITTANTPPRDELETALDGASMGNNKTLIIAMVNKAYVEGETSMLSLFLESFWLGENTRFLVNHLLLVTVDQIAFDRCKFLRLHCYRLVTEGVDFGGEKLYMSKEFIKMMWRRTLFLGDVLKRGYSFIFTDTDVMWLNNPFSRLSRDENEDIQISCDQFYGNPWSEANPMNTGFYFVRSNTKTIALFDMWYVMKDNSNYTRMKEQDVLVSLMRKGVFRELGLKVRFLETLYFSGFCQDSKDFKVVCTVHANCCRSIHAKVADLTAVLRDWKKFKMVSTTTTNETSSTVRWSSHLACANSWRMNINSTN